MKKKRKSKIDWKLLIISLFIVYFVAYVGSTFVKLDNWYLNAKPSITPPNFVFPIVWTILFFLIGLAFYFSFSNLNEKNEVVLLYAINFLLNILWSFFYFTMHNTKFSLFIIFLLIISIAHLIIFNLKKSKISSYLLIPYLLWVFFASLLNILSVLKGV